MKCVQIVESWSMYAVFNTEALIKYKIEHKMCQMYICVKLISNSKGQ